MVLAHGRTWSRLQVRFYFSPNFNSFRIADDATLLAHTGTLQRDSHKVRHHRDAISACDDMFITSVS